MTHRRVTDGLFLSALCTVSFIALRWPVAGVEPKLADAFIALFLSSYVAERLRSPRRPQKGAIAVLAWAAAIGVAYFVALPSISENAGRMQFAKAIAYFALHAAFLAAGVDHLSSRSPRFFRIAFGFLLAGIAANATYAAAQLVGATIGFDVDHALLSRLTDAKARSMWYGVMYGPDVMRARGLVRDPNHLGVMLVIPTLALLAISARLQSFPRRRIAIFAAAALTLVLVLTLSRSALVGLAVGVLYLIATERRRLRFRVLLLPLATAALALGLVAAANPHRAEHVALARLGLHGASGAQHFRTYLLIKPALQHHLLFGVGLNNFPLTYAQRVNGVLEASDSFYVQSLVEAGVIGSSLILLSLGFLLYRLHRLEPHPVAAVLGAPLVGTLAANAFYMTLTFTYVAAFLIFVVAAVTHRPSDRGDARRSRPLDVGEK
jgi:O-antigen ligase